MLKAFYNHVTTHFPRIIDTRVLVAVSGGVDSVVLAHLCRASELEFAIAHCNFHLRDQESNRDEKFVRDLGKEFGVDVHVQSFQTNDYAAEKNLSVQMAARELRYGWFEQLRRNEGYDGILTAHHADDNLETFLINVVRGTGLQGLCGIPPVNGHVLRPLLPFSREEIEAYALKNDLEWREDSTNASAKYLRNRLRLDVIPVLKELNPQLIQSFGNTQEYLKQSSRIIEDYTGAIFSKVASKMSYGYAFNIPLLKTIPNTQDILYELFRTFGFTAWNDVYSLLDAQTGKMVVSPTHRLVKDRDKLLLTELPKELAFALEIEKRENHVMFPGGSFHFEEVETMELGDKRVIYVDQSRITYPLVVRKWMKGDHFHPFGMNGSKKISKYFKDNKFSLPDKENCLVLVSAGKIVWVVGHRADSRFRVKKETRSILKITYEL